MSVSNLAVKQKTKDKSLIERTLKLRLTGQLLLAMVADLLVLTNRCLSGYLLRTLHRYILKQELVSRLYPLLPVSIPRLQCQIKDMSFAWHHEHLRI